MDLCGYLWVEWSGKWKRENMGVQMGEQEEREVGGYVWISIDRGLKRM